MQENKKAQEALDITDFDTSVDPASDFYTYANGGWIKKNPLPPEFSRFGTFDKLADDNNGMLRTLVEELAGNHKDKNNLAGKLGIFYATGINEDALNDKTAQVLAQIRMDLITLTNIQELSSVLAALHKNGVSAFYGFFGSPDSKNAEMVVPHLAQSGLGLPERDYYISNEKRSVEIREEYTRHIQKVFILAGYDEKTALEFSQQVMLIEMMLAEASMTRLERRDPHKTYHKLSPTALKELSPSFDWGEYFNAVGLPQPGDTIVMQPDFIRAMDEVLNVKPIKEVKIYLEWQLLRYSCSFLSTDFVDANFEFYGKFLSGTETLKPRWKRVLSATNEALGEALGKLYVEKYFPPHAKTRMLTLVENLKAALALRISDLEWMSEKTKAYALEKLDTIRVKIGYPDQWRDFSGLEIDKDHYLLNVMRAHAFEFEYMVSKINKPVDREEWFMPPQTVNAYYSPNLNEICFPAGILQPPFFYADADDALNYGAIGMVIGHEMTHGFDDQGRHYDKHGNLVNWWTDEDAERFNARAQVLVDQFNSYEVAEGVFANGELTLGENIADLGGLNVSLTAYKNTNSNEAMQMKTGGFTGLQRFFLAYAHVWAQNIRLQEVLRRVKEDVHSPGDLRVNGPLPNMKEFHDAFEINEGDAMFLPKEKRADIW